MLTVRPAAVAGKFYPEDRERLEHMVQAFLAKVPAYEQKKTPKAIIAPHAGYIYSGPIAAAAYARLRPMAGDIRRVVLIGPAHWVSVRGLALSSASAFATPLGEVPIDLQASHELIPLPQTVISDEAHQREHGLEVHLPFLQLLLDDFFLVPLVVGSAREAEVAAVLAQLWGGPETSIIISSDLSHYHEYGKACTLDQMTAGAIEALEPLFEGQACGRLAINGLLAQARQRHLQVETLDLRNSGDTGGPRHQVVGYGAFAFWENGGSQ